MFEFLCSFDAAAREIAENPRDREEICAKYGIFLHRLSKSEIDLLDQLIYSYSE